MPQNSSFLPLKKALILTIVKKVLMLCLCAQGGSVEFCSYEVLVGRTFVINVLSEPGIPRAVLACIRKNSHLSGGMGVLARIIPHLFISSTLQLLN